MSLGRVMAMVGDVAPNPGNKSTGGGGGGAGGTNIHVNPEAVERRFADRLGPRVRWVRLAAVAEAALAAAATGALVWRRFGAPDWPEFFVGLLAGLLILFGYVAVRGAETSRRNVMGLEYAGWAFGPIFLLVGALVDDRVVGASLLASGAAAIGGSILVLASLRRVRHRSSLMELAAVFGEPPPRPIARPSTPKDGHVPA